MGQGLMVTARADKFMLALLELHGVIPHAVAEAACKWYDTPQPVNYETAGEFVHEQIHILLESGALDDELGELSGGAPMGSSPRRVTTDGRPPSWWLSAYRDAYGDWDALSGPEPEEC
jgi:hypothetical protein